MSDATGNPSTTASPISGALSGSLLPAVTSEHPGPDLGAAPPVTTISDIHKSQKRRGGFGTKRHKLPKDNRVYKVAMATIALKAQGKTYAEIEEILGVGKGTPITYLRRAHTRGWVNIADFSDPNDQLGIVLASKAVRNINTILDETVTDEDTAQTVPTVRAGDAAMEVAKGLGLLVNHQAVKNDTPQTIGFALSVNVQMPSIEGQGSVPQPRIGTIGGAFAEIAQDAEILEGT